MTIDERGCGNCGNYNPRNFRMDGSVICQSCLEKEETLTEVKREMRSHLTTAEAAYYLNRKPQTLRTWACLETGPIRPIRINGRLAWSVKTIREILSS